MAFKSKKSKFNTEDLLDYKSPDILARYLSSSGHIQQQKASGLTAKKHRKLVREIKKARYLGLMPYSGKVQFRG